MGLNFLTPTQPNPSDIQKSWTQPDPTRPNNPWMDPTRVNLCNRPRRYKPKYTKCLVSFRIGITKIVGGKPIAEEVCIGKC